MDCSSIIDAQAHSSLRISTEHHEIASSPSLASSPSSSTSSVFSFDAPSSQSSVSSASSSWDSENDASYLLSHAVLRQPLSSDSALHAAATTSTTTSTTSTTTTPAAAATAAPAPPPTICQIQSFNPVASECRQHPRRTQPQAQTDGCSTATIPRPPPSLVRQSERKDNFVESLVDTTTQMIETIWPLSVMSCGRDTSNEGKNQNLIGLRTFVQEVLRRSKTSYSTLQVALYYLILVQSCLPRHDFTMEQREDSQTCRAMQCGRRMFLASLILASKYLQDRNFSARAWSKISGLKACEINANELAFLAAVNWKLHIPEPVFQRWTDIVLKYSPSASSLSSPRSSPCVVNMWKAVIPRLTPALDAVEFGHAELAPTSNEPQSRKHCSPVADFQEFASSNSNEPTPTNACQIPRTLEPTPRATCREEAILPALPRLGPLPTPKLTPQPNGFNTTFSTPAVGAEGLCPRRTSMSIAMQQVQNACTARMTLDNPNPSWRPVLPQPFPTSARRSSLARSSSSLSSPESMVSDVSSRSSRSSSISSVASSTCALPLSRPGGLAAQATRRCANMQLSGIRETQPSMQPALLETPTDDGSRWEAWIAEKPLSASPSIATGYEGNCVAKPVEATSQSIMTCTASAHEAASALQDLALNFQSRPRPPSSRPAQSCKRKRPLSMDLGTQESVRDLIAPRCLADVTNGNRENEDDSTVLPDGKVADSFLVPKSGERQVKGGLKENKFKPTLAKEGPYKRSCGNAAKQEAYRIGRLATERAMQPRPGMWDGII